MTKICVWKDPKRGYLWDNYTTEGSLGWIRPNGPFGSKDRAILDARKIYKDLLEVHPGGKPPAHYPDGFTIEDYALGTLEGNRTWVVGIRTEDGAGGHITRYWKFGSDPVDHIKDATRLSDYENRSVKLPEGGFSWIAPTAICLWFQEEIGYFWDLAKRHGGYDDISPVGPFGSHEAAIEDAEKCFGHAPDIEHDGAFPLYYPENFDTWHFKTGKQWPEGSNFIFSKSEHQHGAGFWSNDIGWVDRKSATPFTDHERSFVRLPLGDGIWVPHTWNPAPVAEEHDFPSP